MVTPADPRKFTREPATQRRGDLIDATLAIIAETGVASATVRGIAARAGVTPGLIRHYFSTKEDLIAAAYDFHMNRMTDAATTGAEDDSPRAQLEAFVIAALSPPVLNPDWVALWAAFFSKAVHDPRMSQTHEVTYRYFRDRLERLIDAALRGEGQDVPPLRLRQMAIACNAVLDGLWLEGGALPDTFGDHKLPDIGLRSVGSLIGLKLKNMEETQ